MYEPSNICLFADEASNVVFRPSPGILLCIHACYEHVQHEMNVYFVVTDK